MRAVLRFISVLLVASPLTAQGGSEQPRRLDDPALQPRINEAIEQGIEHLQAQQHRDGSWTGAVFGSYRSGPTAFTAYALLESGVHVDSPCIQLALEYLRRNPPRMTYSAGALLLLLAEIGGAENLEWAQATLDQLIAWESSAVRGTWSYPSGPVDLSNTQFVALGFWAAHRLGLDVPLNVSKRLAEATFERHQEEPWVPENPARENDKKKRTRSKGGQVAGFHYFLERHQRPPTASMTAAGICVLRICRLVHGKKLGSRLLKSMGQSEQLGLGWLGEHWSLSENHGHPEGGQLLYYLYAIERLGAFFESETIAGHPWYEDGARVILGLQKSDGAWGRLHETCYSILFLSRASQVASGPSRAALETSWSLATGPVHLRATGSMDVVAWIEKLEIEPGDRVASVEWLVDEVLVATVPGDSTAPWRGERFAIQWSNDEAGPAVLRAVVHLVHESDETVELESGELQIESRWTSAEWMARALSARGPNLLEGVELTLESSSEAAGQHVARVADGLEGTPWVAASTDETPRVVLRIPRGVRAEVVTLSHPASSVARIGSYSGARRVRLTVNGKSSEHEIPAESPGTIVIQLPKRVRVKELAVEILEAAGSVRRGFAEIGLR